VSFASDVRRGLRKRPYRLPPLWFYDELGSRLFDAICLLPWYRITRAERRLLPRAARAMARGTPRPAFVAELGPGNGEKLTLFLENLGGDPRVLLVDISPEALAASTARLAKAGFDRVAAVRGTYEAGLARIARGRPKRGSTLVLFLGSNVGNFEPPRAARFLSDVRSALEPGDCLLLGADLVKPEEDLILAYDDPLGVTAAFNRNVLARMNRELGADIDLTSFSHRAVWNAGESRVEMFLVSRLAQTVRIPGARLEVPFRNGESIFTEASYKYVSGDLRARVEAAGFAARRHFEDRAARYALTLFTAVSRPR
jgi:dimethylhistidine N-methyltransferase